MKKQLILALAAMATAVGAFAADYPVKDKPITLVVPFPPGPTDRVARDLAEALRKPLGTTILVENVSGASGSIGAAKVAKAAPDGYTLLVHHIGMATMPSLLRTISFKVDTDFEYLGMINEVPMTLIAKPQMAAANYRDLLAWISDNKSKVNIGNAGIGSASHLCGMMFQNAIKVDMTTVPYKGTGPALTDLMGGQIDLLCDQTTNTTPQIEGKKVKAYAVTTSKRVNTPVLKDLPTLEETGARGFNVSIWHGLYAPKGLPADVATKINNALKVALKDPDFVKKMETLGAVVIDDRRTGMAEHKAFVASEISKWSPVIKAAGVYAD